MNMLDWFRPKNKKNVVLPSLEDKDQLHGFELVKAFTTETEPKIKDFPRSQYKVYWETHLESVRGGGYHALVRVYSFDTGKVAASKEFVHPTITELKTAVDEFIRTTLAGNKR